MKPTRLFRSFMVLSLCGTVLGCQDIGNFIQGNPQLAPIFGGRTTPPPFTLEKGNIQGFVFGASGNSQPIPLAFVTTGSISANAANPQPPGIATRSEFLDASNANKQIDVIHDFNDGKGPVLCTRIVRQNPPSQNKPDLYVYLHTGEFFLEGVPVGSSSLTASFGNTSSVPQPVTVYSNATVNGENLALNLPTAVQPANGDTGLPHVASWISSTPAAGIVVQVQTTINTTPGGSSQVVNLSYTPDPPDAYITLKAPPGSAGTIIQDLSINYTFVVPGNGPGSGLNQLAQTPIDVPISPVIVPAAEATAYGPPAVIQVPIGSAALKNIFLNGGNTSPAFITTLIQFKDDTGKFVQDANSNNLQAAVTLRVL
jgi:hypothetical protein